MLLVEHPRSADRALTGVEPVESTESFHRFRIPLAAQQATALAVSEVVSRQANVSLERLTRPQLGWFAAGTTPARIREQLGEIVDPQEQITTMENELTDLEDGIETLFTDQERLRENITALGDGPEDRQLRSRYLQQLQSQEDRIDASRARIDALTKEMTTLRARRSDSISRLAFGA